MKNQPPQWADRFLEWYCNPDLIEDLQGDLHEIYYSTYSQGRKRKASYIFIWLVFRSFRFSVINRNKLPKTQLLDMTRNNLKIAFRVLKKEKLNSALNIVGLAIGITCFLLMGTYVRQELSFDQFHSKKDRIHRIWLKEDYGNDKVFFNAVTPLIFETTLEENLPEIETAVQINNRSYLIGKGENRNNDVVSIVSPELFDVFDFKLILGNEEAPLAKRTDMVLSQSYAQKYFGDQSPIGQSIFVQINEEITEFIVSAVMADIPRESSIQIDMAISNANNELIYGRRALTAWFNVSPETYVLVKDAADVSVLDTKIDKAVMKYLPDDMEEGVYNIGFQPLTNIHLNTDIPAGIAPVGRPKYVYILGIIGLLVLVIACVNYTTISMGQSLTRSREVAIRKVMGAWKSNLIIQYLSESFVVAVIAMLLAVGASILLFPIFNEITSVDIQFTFEWWHILVYLGIASVIGLFAGIYPSLILSNFRIITVLRGFHQSKGGHLTRRGVVVFQFLVTILLLSSTLIMRSQFKHLQTKDLGFKYKTAVSVPLYPDPEAGRFSEIIGSAFDNGELLKAKLQQYPEVTDIGMGSHVFGNNGWANLFYTDNEELFRGFRMLIVDPHYLKTFGIEMAAGRAFDPQNTTDKNQSIILNETAVRYFGLDDPIGKKLPGNDFGDHRIIGVVKDFNYSSLHTEIEPLVITQNMIPIIQGISDTGFSDSPVPKLVFNYSGTQLIRVKEVLNEAWQQTFPNEELRFNFVDENMNLMYENEAKMNRMVLVASLLALFISSLGLFGLTILIVNSRTKEIGIRKVMGASVTNIFKLLSNSFAIQLLIAIALSVPLTYWQMNLWLEDFAYRINIGFIPFIASGVIAAVIGLIVIFYHTVRAARVNPVDSLRTE